MVSGWSRGAAVGSGWKGGEGYGWDWVSGVLRLRLTREAAPNCAQDDRIEGSWGGGWGGEAGPPPAAKDDKGWWGRMTKAGGEG